MRVARLASKSVVWRNTWNSLHNQHGILQTVFDDVTLSHDDVIRSVCLLVPVSFPGMRYGVSRPLCIVVVWAGLAVAH